MLEEFELGSLMSRPDLPKIAESINEVLRQEQMRREKFRDELSPNIKAEFIGWRNRIAFTRQGQALAGYRQARLLCCPHM